MQTMRADEHAFFESDNTLQDFFEKLVCNSELLWISADDTGDLTGAPMLAILGPEERAEKLNCGYILSGADEKSIFCQPVLFRWGFMAYQIKSPLADLLECGKCVFNGGPLIASAENIFA